MKILVCYKYVRDENEIRVAADRTLDTESASWVISPYDTIAIEAGMKLQAQAEGSTVEVLTVGTDVVENSKMRKAVLSRGPSKMYAVKAPCTGDLLSTAKLLAQAVERIGGVDLVICGDGSGDMYSQILGVMLGARLGFATLNAVSALSFEDGTVKATRTVGSRSEKYDLPLPAVVSVTSDINRARIPSMKDILAAGKKPVELWDAAEFEGSEAVVKTLSILAPENTERLQRMFASDEEGLQQFAQILRDNLKGVK